ncbi:MAG: hypothetical protein E6J45_11665 [Chloroflexi bacterium]|nr:MAG: hypothetical protein E6J45_11665 [Chloroflexota bacterium]
MKTIANSKAGTKQPLNKYPRGWTRKMIRELAEYYDNQTEDEAVAEDEAAFNDPTQAVVLVPQELVPQVHRLIARHNQAKRRRTGARAK